MSFAFMKCFACPQVAILPSVCFTILVVSSTRSRYETVSAGAPPFVQPHRSSNWIGTERSSRTGFGDSRQKRVGPSESGHESLAKRVGPWHARESGWQFDIAAAEGELADMRARHRRQALVVLALLLLSTPVQGSRMQWGGSSYCRVF